MTHKSQKFFQERDTQVVLKVKSTTFIHVIEVNENEFILKFYHSDIINEYKKKFYKQWPITTIVVRVIEIKDKYEKFEQLHVPNRDIGNDNEIVRLSPQFTKEYTHIVKLFNNLQCDNLIKEYWFNLTIKPILSH